MRHVDCLSRNPPKNATDESVLAILDETDWIAAMQEKDEEVHTIKRVLEGSLLEAPGKKDIIKNYQLKQGRVYKRTKDGLKFVVPRGARYGIIQTYHDRQGHPGIDRTVDNILKNFWFSRLRNLVKKYIGGCINCCQAKRGPDESNYELHVVEKVAIPFQVVHVDHCGPYPRGRGGMEHILMIVDAFTKYTVLRAVKSTNAAGVIKVVKEISQYFGMPETIVSDRGAAFTSKTYEDFCSEHGIKRALVATKTPRANGQAERYFRMVGEGLRAMSAMSSGTDWVTNLPNIQWGINSSTNRVTGKSPQELLFGFRPRNSLENMLISALMDEDERVVDDDKRMLDEMRHNTSVRMLENQRIQANKHNVTHKLPQKYDVGDLVLIKWDPPATGGSRKLMINIGAHIRCHKLWATTGMKLQIPQVHRYQKSHLSRYMPQIK